MKISATLVFLIVMISGCVSMPKVINEVNTVANRKTIVSEFEKAQQEAQRKSDCNCVGTGFSEIQDDNERAKDDARIKAENDLLMCVGAVDGHGKPTPCADKNIDEDLQYIYGEDDGRVFALAFFPKDK